MLISFFDVLVVHGLRPTIPKNINPKLVELLLRCWKAVPSRGTGSERRDGAPDGEEAPSRDPCLMHIVNACDENMRSDTVA